MFEQVLIQAYITLRQPVKEFEARNSLSNIFWIGYTYYQKSTGKSVRLFKCYING